MLQGDHKKGGARQRDRGSTPSARASLPQPPVPSVHVGLSVPAGPPTRSSGFGRGGQHLGEEEAFVVFASSGVAWKFPNSYSILVPKRKILIKNKM